jgi:hypothetical protein
VGNVAALCAASPVKIALDEELNYPQSQKLFYRMAAESGHGNSAASSARLRKRGVAFLPAVAGRAGELQSKLQKKLNKYEFPCRFYFLSALPETPTSKIDRDVCPKTIIPNLK